MNQPPSVPIPHSVMPYDLARSTVASASQSDRMNARMGELYGEALSTAQVDYLFAVKSLAMFHQFGASAFHCALQRPGFPSGNHEI
jgi:hypothetical protein